MRAFLRETIALLRDTRHTSSLRQRLTVLLLCGSFYGAVMGTFGGFASERIGQSAISGLKVPLLLLLSCVLSLPSFFVLNTLLGVRSDFPEVLQALLGSQAALTVVLASLAPYTALWYLSFADYQHALLFNGLIFGLATLSGQLVLQRAYRPLIARKPQHRWLFCIWLFLYSFTAVQLAWVLRPFIGDPEQPVQFFRAEAWSNAYVVLAQLVSGLLRK